MQQLTTRGDEAE